MNECGVCLKKYNEYENKLILLICGDTLCLRCINYYKEALRKDVFECRIYGTNTKSTGVIKMMAYKKDIDIPDIPTSFLPGEFKILIKSINRKKYSIIVTKTMTIGELKDKIEKEIGINKANIILAYKKPLIDLSKTLEYYGIIEKVTLRMINNIIGGGPSYLKEINIKFIKVQKNTNKSFKFMFQKEEDLYGLLKLCLLKEISSKYQEEQIKKLPDLLSYIIQILKNGYIIDRISKEDIKKVLEKMKGSNILNFSKYIDKSIDSNQIKMSILMQKI